jgi:lipopolysaccharide biosynthesis glycosyltransferase
MALLNQNLRTKLKKHKFFKLVNDFRNVIRYEVKRIANERKKSAELQMLKSKVNYDIVGNEGKLSLAKINNIFVKNNKDFKDETALIFLVDHSYLKPFTTLMYTLHRTNSFNNVPKVVLTIDNTIVDNRIVHELSDEVFLFKLEDLHEIKMMNDHKHNPYFRKSYINNVTFLKLLAFKFLGYRRHIFLDCDMLCVNNADELLQVVKEADLAGAPTVSLDIYYKAGTPSEFMDVNYYNVECPHLLPLDQMDRNYVNLFKKIGSSSNYIPRQQMNSGVLLINEAMINDTMYSLLAILGQISKFPGDQNLIYRMTQLIEDINYRCLPVWYNVNRPTYDYLGREIYERDMQNIIFHHYSGGNKPWQNEFKYGKTWVDLYWLNEYDKALKYFDFPEEMIM